MIWKKTFSRFFLMLLMIFGLVPVNQSSALSFDHKAKTLVGLSVAIVGAGGAWYCHSKQKSCEEEVKKELYRKLKWGSGTIGLAGVALALWGGYEWHSGDGNGIGGYFQYEVSSKLFGKFDVIPHKDGSFTINSMKIDAQEVDWFKENIKEEFKKKISDDEFSRQAKLLGDGIDMDEVKNMRDSVQHAFRNEKEFSVKQNACMALAMFINTQLKK